MITRVIEIKLEQLLTERKKSLYAISRETGVAYNALSKIKKNQVKSVTFDVLEKLCLSLDCTVGELLVVSSEKKAH